MYEESMVMLLKSMVSSERYVSFPTINCTLYSGSVVIITIAEETLTIRISETIRDSNILRILNFVKIPLCLISCPPNKATGGGRVMCC